MGIRGKETKAQKKRTVSKKEKDEQKWGQGRIYRVRHHSLTHFRGTTNRKGGGTAVDSIRGGKVLDQANWQKKKGDGKGREGKDLNWSTEVIAGQIH